MVSVMAWVPNGASSVVAFTFRQGRLQDLVFCLFLPHSLPDLGNLSHTIKELSKAITAVVHGHF